MRESRTILCVDDDADDRELLATELKHADNHVGISEADDGTTALAYLSAAKATHQLPCVIVLDINMPRLDGRKTFEHIKKDPALQHIPIVVYTSSNSPHDASFFRQKGIEVISKPMTFKLLPQIARTIVNYCH